MERGAPVFLVGAERSGSTMLRLMLAHHPQIAFAGESDFIVDAITPEGRTMKRGPFIKMLALDRVFQDRGFTIAQGLAMPALANDFIDQVAASKPGAVVAGMTIHRHFDRLLFLWPKARFIHLVRDGRDVALSTIPMGWAGNMYAGIRLWVEAEECWSAVAEKLPDDQYITVNYEALIADPEIELNRITHFLGLQFSPEMMRYDERSTYSAPHGASIGKWRKSDPADLTAAEFRAARYLLQGGYLLSGSVREPSAFRRLALRVQDRTAVALHRKRLFGTKLWLRGILVRRLRGKKGRDQVIRAENAVIARTLK